MNSKHDEILQQPISATIDLTETTIYDMLQS